MLTKLIYTSLLSFLIGVLLGLVVSQTTLVILLIIGSILFLISLFKNKSPLLLIVSIGVFSLVLGSIRFKIAEETERHPFDNQIGEHIEVTGKIVAEPQNKPGSSRIVVKTEGTKLLVIGDPGEFSYADTVEVEGTLALPENFETDQGTVFDYVHYLEKDGILYMLNSARAEVVKSPRWNLIRSLVTIKHAIEDTLGALIPGAPGALLDGILLGSKRNLPDTVRNDFVTTGTIHIVALSGYNVTIVAEAIMRIFYTIFSRSISLVLGSVGIVLFVMMTGFQSSAIRASIMALLALFGKYIGRPYAIIRALLFAAVLMVLVNPLILPYDISFQLSFIATLGIIFLSPIFEHKLAWIKSSYIRSLVSTTLSAECAVIPLVLYSTGLLSLIALPVNIIIVPLVPIAMLLGFLVMVFGFLSHTLAFPFAFIATGLLNSILGITHFFAQIPFAAITMPHVSFIIILILYGVLCTIVFTQARRHPDWYTI